MLGEIAILEDLLGFESRACLALRGQITTQLPHGRVAIAGTLQENRGKGVTSPSGFLPTHRTFQAIASPCLLICTNKSKKSQCSFLRI